MPKMQSANFEIKKLNASNSFELWKCKIQHTLVLQRVEKALLHRKKKPVDVDVITRKTWMQEPLVLFVYAWKMICCSLTNRIYLKGCLYNIHVKEGAKISDHLNSFNTLLCQFYGMDVNLEGEEKSITLLCCLLESWDQFVNYINFVFVDTIDFDTIVGV